MATRAMCKSMTFVKCRSRISTEMITGTGNTKIINDGMEPIKATGHTRTVTTKRIDSISEAEDVINTTDIAAAV